MVRVRNFPKTRCMSHVMVYVDNVYVYRGVGIGGATGARAPLNF